MMKLLLLLLSSLPTSIFNDDCECDCGLNCDSDA